TRHDLFNENNPSANFAIHSSLYVESQIDLLKIHVKRHTNSQNTRVQEHKPDKAHETLPIVKIEFAARRNERLDQRRINRVIRHYQVAPFGCKEFLHTASSGEL